MENPSGRLVSGNGAAPETAPFTLNPAEFPPLNSANPPESLPESTLPNSSKTKSSHVGKSFSYTVGSHSANREQSQQANFGKFFLADAEPNAIGACHNINGRPTITFSDEETQSLVADFRLALIGKFSHGIPPYSQLHCLLAKTGIKGTFTVSLINKKHALISLSKESDFSRLWMRRIWYLNGFPMRVFKWSPTFTPEQESAITPIWVCLPELPAHLFRKDALFAIANNIGTPLQIADSTFNQSNLANARNIVYEQVPDYCSLCKHVGHRDAECYSKGDAPKPPSHRRKFKKKMRYVSLAVLNSQKEIGELPQPVCNDEAEIIHVENHVFVAANDVFDAEIVNSVAENDSIRVMETVVELDGNGNDGNETLDGETIDVACSGGPVGDCNNTSVIETDVNAENDILDCENTGFACGVEEKNVGHPTENENEENAFNLGEKAVGIMITRPNNIVGDLRRGKKWISVDTAVRLIQNLKRFGVVIKGIKEDVEEVIKRNKLAVSSAIQYKKCVLLYDSGTTRF
ncbi:hypothetical protein Sango_1895800 [Sesamum angolense]|uniref:DUF4283 domain-containing protein n=1 Tax=Sesamum angolense TaxID=2727404 RepID=A0AAE2BQY9_9LAMI|nr:hypothetical protein Sango_1895800 [Sesamum angolense]